MKIKPHSPLPKWVENTTRRNKRYYMQLHKATPKWANANIMQRVYDLAKATGKHVDHVVPLLNKRVCGLNCEDNLQLLTPSENLRKGNHYWPDMWNEQEDMFGFEPQEELTL